MRGISRKRRGCRKAGQAEQSAQGDPEVFRRRFSGKKRAEDEFSDPILVSDCGAGFEPATFGVMSATFLVARSFVFLGFRCSSMHGIGKRSRSFPTQLPTQFRPLGYEGRSRFLRGFLGFLIFRTSLAALSRQAFSLRRRI